DFSEGSLMNLPIAAVDQDHSTLSQGLIRNLNAGSHAKIRLAEGGIADALAQLRSAEVYAVLVIPPDFEADTLASRQPSTTLYYNALFYGAGFYSTQDFAGLVNAL